MKGIYLHMLADSLGSLGVIISTICVKYYGLLFADSLSSFILACFILASAIPFLKETISRLVLETPPGLKRKLTEVQKELSVISGI
jgi:zinc transporter 5/7